MTDVRHSAGFVLALIVAWSCADAGQARAPSGGSRGSQTGGGAGSTEGAAGATGGAGVSGSGGAAGVTGATGGAGGPGAAGINGGGGTAGDAGTAGAQGTGGKGGFAGGNGAAGSPGGGGAGAGGAFGATFHLGADITDQEPQPVATRTNLLNILKAHGFNSIRLRTFVDPRASDGYDKQNGWAGLEPTVAFGRQIKDAGMRLLIDFHYSDNWADPAKQCVPVAWQGFTSIAQLATAVHDYTRDAIEKLVAGGARPDMVQIGNEITPGLLVHRCDSGGIPIAGAAGINPVNGALYYYSERAPTPPAGAPPLGGWTNLGMLLRAGARGVAEVDPGILRVLHLDRGNDLASSRSFIENAIAAGVPFEVFGQSCYTAFQGPPSGWQTVFTTLARQFPSLRFIIAEYGPDQRPANDIVFNLPDHRGLGTFNWAPTTLGFWNEPNHDLLRRSGTTYTEQPDLALYDRMKIDYASRL